LGKVTVLFGDPDLGKSLITIFMAAQTSRGEAWPDRPDIPNPIGGVVILSAEDDPQDTIRPRLDAAGADVSRIGLLKGVRTRDPGTDAEIDAHFNLATDLVALEEAIKRTPDCRLVIVDPISAYLGGTNSHRNAEVRGVLAPLADLAARRGVAMVGVTHVTKDERSKALYRATGSLAFIAAARGAWLVVEDKNHPQRRLMLPAKMNLAKQPPGLAYKVRATPVQGVQDQPFVAWDPDPVHITADEAIAAEGGSGGGVTARA
jgi:RecA-family ATPase